MSVKLVYRCGKQELYNTWQECRDGIEYDGVIDGYIYTGQLKQHLSNRGVQEVFVSPTPTKVYRWYEYGKPTMIEAYTLAELSEKVNLSRAIVYNIFKGIGRFKERKVMVVAGTVDHDGWQSVLRLSEDEIYSWVVEVVARNGGTYYFRSISDCSLFLGISMNTIKGWLDGTRVHTLERHALVSVKRVKRVEDLPYMTKKMFKQATYAWGWWTNGQ